MSFLFQAKVEAQKISTGLYFNPQGGLPLFGEKETYADFSLWYGLEVQTGNFSIMPLWDFGTNSVGLFAGLSFREELNIAIYLLGMKSVLSTESENYLGLGLDFYLSKENKELNSLNDSSIFLELGSSIESWEPYLSLGITIPVVFVLKE